MSNDSTQRSPSPAISAGAQLLRRRINNIALAGRLKVTEDRAVALLHATCIGIVQSLLRQPENRRDLGLSAEAREAVLFAITTDDNAETETGSIAAAVTLRASLKEHAMLSAGEQHLLGELLDRIASSKP